MSLKETARLAMGRKFGQLPAEAGAFLDDLSEGPQKPAQAAKPVAQVDSAETPRAVSERVVRPKAKDRGDVRKLNATGRDIQFSTRIDPDLDKWIWEVCVRRKAKLRRNQRYGLADFLEDAARALDKEDGVSRETA